MNICIIGTGYVGLSTALGFAKHDHKILCVDIDPKRVDAINAAKCPFFEPGMSDILESAVRDGFLRATLDIKDALKSSEIVFISVPTPCDDAGRIDIKFIDRASKDIAANISGYKVIVVKSTVIPGTTESVVKRNLETAGKIVGSDFRRFS
jgi:UDPglucose 6-dehydrogenase